MSDAVDVHVLSHFPGDDPERLLRPARPGDVGIDLRAAEPVTLPPGARALVPTGIRIALPPGIEAQVRPRSGQALRRGLTLLNTPGTVDPGYRGEVSVILANLQPLLEPGDLEDDGDLNDRLWRALERRTERVERGERIAQLVFARFLRPELRFRDALDDTGRGEGGFGSTGA